MLFVVLVGILVCLIYFILNKEITLFEFIWTNVAFVLVVAITYFFCVLPIDNDIYYSSGKINFIAHYPEFVEEYQQEHVTTYACGTDSKGNTKYCTRVYYTTEHDRHYEYWAATDTLGQTVDISNKFYATIKKDFGNKEVHKVTGRTQRCTHGGHRVRGDNSVYYVENRTDTYNYPTTKISNWYNPLKKSKSIFNTEKDILVYPKRTNWLINNRSMPNKYIKPWDVLNTKIYEKVGANAILTTSTEDLKNCWMKGKKNDIIIQIQGDLEHPDKVTVFGWYKSERLSTELETLILDKGVTPASLPLIQHKILSYYEPFDFNEFKYLRFQLTDWQLGIVIFLGIIVLVLSLGFFSTNEDKRF